MPVGVRVTFHGVRGSTPCEGAQYARYGGHSACISLEGAGEPPILFDLGTGLRPFGVGIGQRAWRGSVLLSHLHWDHVQGLPFFLPLNDAGSVLDVFGPRQVEGSLAEVFGGLMRPPYFPVRPSELGGDVRFCDVGDDDFAIGSAKVTARWVRHVGPTLGFRVEWNGVSVAYVPDHGTGSASSDPEDFVPPEVLELCEGVDLLIHDAQHTSAEYCDRRHWGHCTVDYAVHVAHAAGARCLALFHHDPAHGDDDIDRILAATAEHSARIGGPDVVAAFEGLVLDLDPAAHRAPGCDVDLRTAPSCTAASADSAPGNAVGAEMPSPIGSMASVARASTSATHL
jgi:phosphoribosyl 1,2-cyclic phosphodiesterase